MKTMDKMLEVLNKLQSNWSNYRKEKQEELAKSLASMSLTLEKLVALMDEE